MEGTPAPCRVEPAVQVGGGGAPGKGSAGEISQKVKRTLRSDASVWKCGTNTESVLQNPNSLLPRFLVRAGHVLTRASSGVEVLPNALKKTAKPNHKIRTSTCSWAHLRGLRGSPRCCSGSPVATWLGLVGLLPRCGRLTSFQFFTLARRGRRRRGSPEARSLEPRRSFAVFDPATWCLGSCPKETTEGRK